METVGSESERVLPGIREQLVEQTSVSEEQLEELGDTWERHEEWESDQYLLTIYALGGLLYRLRNKRDKLEVRLARENGWLENEPYLAAVSNYQSPETVANSESLSVREVTGVYAGSAEWRRRIGEVRVVQTLKDDLISELFVQYPPARQTKRSRAFALEKAGFHLWADKKEIAGLLDTSKGYVSSIWNDRGGGNEPTQQERNNVIGRDQGRCVKCNERSDNRQIHHIIPPRFGGSSEEDNLALLCMDCHLAAHDGWFANPPIHDSKEEFWGWTDSSGDES